MAGAKPSLIALERVAKAYKLRGGAQLLAIDEVSLDVGDGEFVTIVGPSGCGKSTLLKLVAGLVFPSRGEIRLDGEPVTGPRRGVGMVFQSAVLLKWKTVLGNVMFPLRIMRLDQPRYEQRARELLEITGLADFADRYPRELSGGMQQRVAICRALVFDPKVLLMDEPFGALDAMTREELSIELLRIWQGARKTVLFVTHSISEAVLLADRVVVMSARPGRVVDVLDVDLPRPRGLAVTETEAFQGYVARIRRLIFGRATAETVATRGR
ncbi:MAG TPA: ABC transporter ATP-binding protein [Methylomirabilota bacterium]|jgi:NitT/TauT family transport system ATP-binding protein|nr:ABC transporter ATP-binding protein [Methylomirabilota bacterium]